MIERTGYGIKILDSTGATYHTRRGGTRWPDPAGWADRENALLRPRYGAQLRQR